MADYLTPSEAAAVARRHPVTIRKALEAGNLHGSQQAARGRLDEAEAATEVATPEDSRTLAVR